MAQNEDFFEMIDENGQVYKFEHLLTFEVDDNFYIAFVPAEQNDEYKSDEVLIMRIEESENEDEDIYLPIETQEELDKLWEIFKHLYYEDEEFEEDIDD